MLMYIYVALLTATYIQAGFFFGGMAKKICNEEKYWSADPGPIFTLVLWPLAVPIFMAYFLSLGIIKLYKKINGFRKVLDVIGRFFMLSSAFGYKLANWIAEVATAKGNDEKVRIDSHVKCLSFKDEDDNAKFLEEALQEVEEELSLDKRYAA